MQVPIMAPSKRALLSWSVTKATTLHFLIKSEYRRHHHRARGSDRFCGVARTGSRTSGLVDVAPDITGTPHIISLDIIQKDIEERR